ncbi:MAG: 2'-5' RNA ligase family protein [Chitinophagaceae bacterium]|nr:2'-5' RNA ligase family protein [Chitinophagaceae bacterium]
MSTTRTQLTLFVSPANEAIEKIRANYNPVQYALIPAHVTLCREDEILEMDKVTENMRSIKMDSPLSIKFGKAERFNEGKGLWLPAIGNLDSFNNLRKTLLKGIIDSPRPALPHITLIHPRNGSCTDEIFNSLKNIQLPSSLIFDAISIIEQQNSDKWKVINEFKLT